MVSPTLPARPGASVERRVATSSGELALVDHGGAGVPVLLLHGMGRSAADWLPVAPQLAEVARVWALDFGCHGRSPDLPGWGIDVAVREVGEVLDALGVDRVVLAGHSLGGMVATLFGATSDRCLAVVNVDGHGTGHPEQFVGLDPEDVDAFLDRIVQLSNDNFHADEGSGD
jgi:pimeloyl-ACP methyl ester carboxylesterase